MFRPALIEEGASLKYRPRMGIDLDVVASHAVRQQLDDEDMQKGIQKLQKELETQPFVPMTAQEIIEAFVGPLNDEVTGHESRLRGSRSGLPTASAIILALDVFNHSNLVLTVHHHPRKLVAPNWLWRTVTNNSPKRRAVSRNHPSHFACN